MLTLLECFDKYKCDKGSLKHRYDLIYEPIFEPLRKQEFSLLEIGIYKGNSTEAFIDYAPKVQIIGLDTFERIKPENISILKHPNVEWLKCDSTKLLTLDTKFDFIIDDGLHTHDAQRLTFQNCYQFLKLGGSYFIEDVWPFKWMTNKEKAHPWLRSHPKDWNDETFDKLFKTITHNTEIIFHDNRKYSPDSCIIEVKNNDNKRI